MQVNLKILRYNPEIDSKAHFETYTVEAEPTDRVLDALNEVKWTRDGTLPIVAPVPTEFVDLTPCASTDATL
jgi:succinate dehydrogenase/fumarate reductase-like Fe-S protein